MRMLEEIFEIFVTSTVHMGETGAAEEGAGHDNGPVCALTSEMGFILYKSKSVRLEFKYRMH